MDGLVKPLSIAAALGERFDVLVGHWLPVTWIHQK